MSYIDAEIESQPACWRHAVALAGTKAVAAELPASGERVAVIGCGTSFFMAQSCAALREAAGQGETDAFAASEFPVGRNYDRIVAITRSGTTTEVLRLLKGLHPAQRSIVLTTDDKNPAAELAASTIVLDFADERSVVQTRFATTALALWRAHLGEDLTGAIRDAEAVLARELPSEYAKRDQFTFLGTGWTIGLANEAALKVREASQSWAEAYPAMEFRHGPISVIDDRSLVWIFGESPVGLVDDLAGTGGLVVQSNADPLAGLVEVHRLAVALAQRKGLDPDAPRNLTRSIVLA